MATIGAGWIGMTTFDETMGDPSSDAGPLWASRLGRGRRAWSHAEARWPAAEPGKLLDVVEPELLPHDHHDPRPLPDFLPQASQPAGGKFLSLPAAVELDQVVGDQPQ